MNLPLVAIVGAPNVGKSTLFNRLVGRRQAIVTDEPGVTRDRLYGLVEHHLLNFEIVDTGGQTPNTEAPFAREIEAQADAALARASLILYVVDARAGRTAIDQDLASRLRNQQIPKILVANKVDTPKQEALAHDLHALRLGEPFTISAEHGHGIDDLVDLIVRQLKEQLSAETGFEDSGQPPTADSPPEDVIRPIRVAIVGRPNVGKSSIFNRLVGEERAVVSEIAGTTRDSVDTLLDIGGRQYRLIDTAGMRRRGKLREDIERFSVHKARKSMERCDVAVLVLDASEPFAAQDAHIAGYVVDANRPMVVIVNKWDLPDERETAAKQWEERIRHRLRFAKNVPLVLVSAKSGLRVPKILDFVDQQYALAGKRVSTPDLNRWLGQIKGLAGTTVASGRGFRLLYATQTGVYPPRFLIFCNETKRLHFSLRRHLENSLRERFDFGASPLRLEFRGRRDGTDS